VDLLGPGSTPNFVVFDLSTPTQPVLLGQSLRNSNTFLADLTFVGTTGFSSTSWFNINSANDITALNGDFLAFDFSAFTAAIDFLPGPPTRISLLPTTSTCVRTLWHCRPALNWFTATVRPLPETAPPDMPLWMLST